MGSGKGEFSTCLSDEYPAGPGAARLPRRAILEPRPVHDARRKSFGIPVDSYEALREGVSGVDDGGISIDDLEGDRE